MAWWDIINEFTTLLEALFVLGFSISFTQLLQANPTNPKV